MPSFDFVRDWFIKAADGAKRQGRKDSALLWKDGLAQLDAMHTEIAVLKARAEKLERLAEAAKVLSEDKLFKKYQAVNDALKALENPDA